MLNVINFLTEYVRKHSLKKMKIKWYKIFIKKKSVKSTRFKKISRNLWPISTWDLQTTYFCRSLWSKLNVCVTIISDPGQPCMCCFGWIQWQPFKCSLLNVFLFSSWQLFLKKMGISTASNPHCHFRLSQPILKILPVYRKNILLK